MHRAMDGLLIIDKPAGMTSAQVVATVKHRLHRKTGHLGTLDPFASGVLPLCIGEGTKIAQFLNTSDKDYAGVIQLGMATDTGDHTGTPVHTAPVPPLESLDLGVIAHRFLGDALQVPPMYSAVKRAGTRLYKLARKGIDVDREPRPIRIHALALALVGADRVRVTVSCSKGTYVRVLAEHIAQALGTVGHLVMLQRTRFDRFGIDAAQCLEVIDPGSARIIPLRECLVHLKEIELAPSMERRARQGYEPLLAHIAPGRCGEAVKLVSPSGALTAVIVMHESGRWQFARVFADSTATK